MSREAIEGLLAVAWMALLWLAGNRRSGTIGSP